MFIDSEKVNIFPTSRRNNNKSKLNTEENIVNLTNRLTNNGSYIIKGLDIVDGENSYSITEGECVINGYWFKLSQIDGVLPYEQLGNYKYIYYAIKINKSDISTNDFTEIICTDYNNEGLAKTLDTETLDNQNNSTWEFKGIDIILSNSLIDDSSHLLIAEEISENQYSKWIKPNDSQIIKNSPQIIDDGEIR